MRGGGHEREGSAVAGVAGEQWVAVQVVRRRELRPGGHGDVARERDDAVLDVTSHQLAAVDRGFERGTLVGRCAPEVLLVAEVAVEADGLESVDAGPEVAQFDLGLARARPDLVRALRVLAVVGDGLAGLVALLVESGLQVGQYGRFDVPLRRVDDLLVELEVATLRRVGVDDELVQFVRPSGDESEDGESRQHPLECSAHR